VLPSAFPLQALMNRKRVILAPKDIPLQALFRGSGELAILKSLALV